MKKIIKICAGASALLAGCGVMASSPVINNVDAAGLTQIDSYVEINTNGEFAFSAVNMQKTVKAGEKFYIPIPKVSNIEAETVVKINVKAGSVVHTYIVGEANANTPFTLAESEDKVEFHYASNITYKVYYTAEKGGKTYTSSVYRINVEGIQYSYHTELTDKLPTIAGVDDKILIPTLKVVDAEGKVVKDGENEVVASISVKKNNETVGVTENGALRQDPSGNYYLYAMELGTYTITYSVAGYNIADKVVDVKVESWFDSSKMELDTEAITLKNVDLNVETKLPEAKVNDLYHDKYSGSKNIPHNTTVTIKNYSGTVVATLTGDQAKSYTFTASGTYTLEYKVSSLYLKNVKEDTYIVKDVIVSDRTAPKVYLVEDYETKDGEGNPIENWEENIVKLDDSAIATRTGWGGITLPALYAEDLGAGYEGLTFSRVVIDSKGNETIVDGDINKSVVYKGFPKNEKGTYTIEYRAVDKASRSNPLVFAVEVSSDEVLSFTDDTNLEIKLPSIENDIFSDEVKTVKVEEPSDDKDEAIDTRYYYYYGAETIFTEKLDAFRLENTEEAYNFDEDFLPEFNALQENKNKLQRLSVSDNQLTIELTDFATTQALDKTKITIVAVAINDQGQFVTAVEEVGIKNATDDSVAPTMTMDASSLNAEYKLGEDSEVVLPFAVFDDGANGARNLKISTKYYIDKIENIDTDLLSFENIRIGNSVSGVVPITKAGTYYIIYTAVDHNNNSYDYVTTFKVTKEKTYRVEVEYSSSVEIFETSEINAYVYDDEGNKVTPVSMKFEETTILDRDFEGTEITFYEPGSYSFKAIAEVTTGVFVESAKLTITVNDLEYKWDNESSISSYVASSVAVDEYVVISKIPTYTYDNDRMFADIKVVDDNGDEVTVDYVKNDQGVVTHAQFKATKKGKYTTTFVAGEKEYGPIYTYVGDNSSPEISILNKDSIPSKIAYNDKDITLTITNPTKSDESTEKYNVYKLTITAVDKDKKEVFSRDIKVKLFDINWNGQVPMTWSEAMENKSITLNGNNSESSVSYKWTITEKGEYTLSFVAKDGAGNSSTSETITFNISEKSASKDKKDNKAGIILIVVALVILAGIVSFFAFAGKGKNTSKPKTVKSEVKKDEDKE